MRKTGVGKALKKGEAEGKGGNASKTKSPLEVTDVGRAVSPGGKRNQKSDNSQGNVEGQKQKRKKEKEEFASRKGISKRGKKKKQGIVQRAISGKGSSGPF